MPGTLLRATFRALLVMTAAVAATSALGQTAYRIDVPAQQLDEALRSVGRQTGTNVIFEPRVVRGLKASAVAGELGTEDAIRQLLAGTGLSVQRISDDTVVVKRAGEEKSAPDAVGKPIAGLSSAGLRLARADGGGQSADEERTPANSTDASAGAKVEEIIVTAQKRAELSRNVPLSVSAFTTKTLEDSGAARLADFLGTVPGVGIVDDERGTASVEIRGVNSTFGAALVGYYIDELPFSLLGNNFGPDVRTYDLERVEVLRGPQGTLYGDGSIGGTIRILTRDPDLQALHANVDLTGSSTSGGDGSYAAKGMLNVPLKENVLGLRVVASKEDFGGWVDNLTSGVENQNERTIGNYRAKLRFAPDDRLDVVLSAWRSEQDSDAEAVSFADGTARRDPIVRATDYDLYSATIRYHFSAFDLVSATSKMKYDQKAAGFLFGGRLIINQAADVLSEELRFTSNSSGRFRWTGGLFYRKLEETSLFGLVIPPVLNLNVPGGGTSESYAVFGEGTVALSGKLDLTFGLRYFNDDRADTSPVDPATLAQLRAVDPTFSPGKKVSFNTFNPRLNLALHPNADWLLYTNIAKGFRSGLIQGMSSLTAAALNNINIPLGVEPETMWSYEVGAKGTLAGGRMLLEGAVYYNDWRDLQVNAVVDPISTVNGFLNGGDARIVGAELSATFLPVDGLTLRLTGGHLNAEFIEDVPGTTIRKGERVNGVPETSASASATYRWPLTASLGGFVFGTVQYTSERTDIVNVALPSDATTIAGLRVGVEQKSWSTYLFVDNITDEDGALDVYFSSYTGESTRPRPRTYGLNVRLDF